MANFQKNAFLPYFIDQLGLNNYTESSKATQSISSYYLNFLGLVSDNFL